MEESANEERCCLNCAWYCARTGFCRKFPPQVVMQYVQRMAFPVAAFPKIQVPAADWCSYFEPASPSEGPADY